MPIEFNCPACGHHHALDEAKAGKLVLCKGCGRRVIVPGEAVVLKAQAKRTGVPPGIKTLPRKHAAKTAAAHSSMTPYGQPRQRRALYLVRGKNWVLIMAAVLSVLSMLMPWISWGEDAPREVVREYGTYVMGIELPILVQRQFDKSTEAVESAYRERRIDRHTRDQAVARIQQAKGGTWSLYSVYLIPALALLCLLDELRASRTADNRWWLRLVNGLSPLIVTVVVIAAAAGYSSPASSGGSTQGGDDLISVGMGYWVAWLAALGSLVSIFTSPKPREDPQTPHTLVR